VELIQISTDFPQIFLYIRLISTDIVSFLTDFYGDITDTSSKSRGYSGDNGLAPVSCAHIHGAPEGGLQ
jgi:hypothetical protein